MSHINNINPEKNSYVPRPAKYKLTDVKIKRIMYVLAPLLIITASIFVMKSPIGIMLGGIGIVIGGFTAVFVGIIWPADDFQTAAGAIKMREILKTKDLSDIYFEQENIYSSVFPVAEKYGFMSPDNATTAEALQSELVEFNTYLWEHDCLNNRPQEKITQKLTKKISKIQKQINLSENAIEICDLKIEKLTMKNNIFIINQYHQNIEIFEKLRTQSDFIL